MTNKIGLTFLLAWFAVMAIVANYSYDRNVPYRGNTGDEYASKMCRLDIAYQPDVQNAPVVVWFHGGGLTGGSREIPSGLLTDGMVVGYEFQRKPHYRGQQNLQLRPQPEQGRADAERDYHRRMGHR